MSLDKTLEEIFNDNYVIPLYQRSFAWREEEIERLCMIFIRILNYFQKQIIM